MIDLQRLWSIKVDETHEREALKALDEHLKGLDQLWVGSLRFKVGAKLAALRRASTPVGEAFAAPYGLPTPNGRWLYQYRLGDAAFAELQAQLKGISDLDALGRGYRPGLFVLWASEWFRRCYRGGGQRWDDLATALGVPSDQNLLRAITATGLRQWRRDIIQAGSAREYLGSLAREGGFPTAAIEGGSGWARAVLEAIVAPLLGDVVAGPERALELAQMQLHRLPQLFRDDAFLQLCADLALAIVSLRREAEPAATAAGIPMLAWLQLNRPDWRETLPLTTGEAAATTLIDGLMTVDAVAGGAVGAERLLIRIAGQAWREAIRITLDGSIDSATIGQLDPREGRLRAFAAGEMARSLPGELALIEPPVFGETAWTARSSRHAKSVQSMPFAAAIELDLRSGERRVARVALRGGKPRRGQLLVGVLDEGTSDAPQALRIVGAGSGKYRAREIYLQTPIGWRVDVTAGETATSLGAGVGETILWWVQGGAFVTDVTGDRFRVICGQPDDIPARIELIGNHPTWAQVDGDLDLYLGSPIAQIARGEGSLFIRGIGSRDWRPAPGTLPVGYYELGWRSNHVLLDRRRIAVLPAAAQLSRSGTGATVQYQLSGFNDLVFTPDSDAPVSPSADGTLWLSRPRSEQVYRFGANLQWASREALSVSIDYPCAAAIAHWDGRVLPNHTQITLDDLGDLVAVNRGPMQLVAEMYDPQNRARAEMSWEYADELPMTSVAAELASLLLPASIDATVKLGMHDGIETYWHLRQFEVRLERSGSGIVASQGVVAADTELCGRALVDPSREVTFGAYSLLSDSNHRPIMLPDDLIGSWLVYLRSGRRILSRPLMVFGASGASAETRLTRAMMLGPREGLDAALSEVLQAAAIDDQDGDAILAELLELVESLGGLPPATFRVLELMAGQPGVLTRLALRATSHQLEAVLALSDGLPFAWCTLPQACWTEAQRAAFERALEQLSALGDQAARFAIEMVGIIRSAIIAREPLLASVFMPIDVALPLADLVQGFLNRAVQRIKSGRPDRYRRVLNDSLPAYFLRFNENVLDTLDAPCAAALAVSGEWTPLPDDIRHIKTVARAFPTYFADAFAATLKEIA